MAYVSGVRFGLMSFKTIQKQVEKAADRKAGHKAPVRRTYVLHNGTRVRLGAGDILQEDPQIAAICLSSTFPRPANHPFHRIPTQQRANTEVFLVPTHLWNPVTRRYDAIISLRTIYVSNNTAYGIDRVRPHKKAKTPAS